MIAFSAAWIGSHLDHPLGPSPNKSWTSLCLFVAIVAEFAEHGPDGTTMARIAEPGQDQEGTPL
jgi:hypothetical protein